MTTSVRRGRTLRSRLLEFIRDATGRLTAAWRILSTAQTRLLDALARIRPGRGGTRAVRTATAMFNRSVADFDRAVATFAHRWAATDLPLIYREGALTTLDHVDRPHRMWSWTQRHQGALTTLSTQYFADLMGRLQEGLRRARAFLRAALDAVRMRFGRFEVATLDRAALLRDHPLGTVIYANDARHPVDAWARAAISWQAVTTANTAAARTALDELGCHWMEVRDGHDCGWAGHSDEDKADGTLRTVQDALAHPTAHANCIREFLPRPDIIDRPDFAFGSLA
ncbi:hypothetical protein AB0D12_31675 [Streptomyces sp. NPDC048479]|uniref:hypothetical protein n=1 Tax=Streptomyces sp. NPDC048479 TaxID=3154725 RepID=UPI003423FC6B